MPLSKALYHTCFILGQRCKWWSHPPKLTLWVISNVKPISYIFCIYRCTSHRYDTVARGTCYIMHAQPLQWISRNASLGRDALQSRSKCQTWRPCWFCMENVGRWMFYWGTLTWDGPGRASVAQSLCRYWPGLTLCYCTRPSFAILRPFLLKYRPNESCHMLCLFLKHAMLRHHTALSQQRLNLWQNSTFHSWRITK